MNLENLLDKNISITQVKGGSKLNQRQKGNLIGLGLRGIGSSSELKATKSVLGMVKKILHIVKVSAN